MYKEYNQKFDIYKFEKLIDFSEGNDGVFNKLINFYEEVSMITFCDIIKTADFVTDLN